MSVARAFHALGAKVKVGARKSEHIARITEMALNPFHLNDLGRKLKMLIFVINTIPFPIITCKCYLQICLFILSSLILLQNQAERIFVMLKKEELRRCCTKLTRNCCPENSRSNISERTCSTASRDFEEGRGK